MLTMSTKPADKTVIKIVVRGDFSEVNALIQKLYVSLHGGATKHDDELEAFVPRDCHENVEHK